MTFKREIGRVLAVLGGCVVIGSALAEGPQVEVRLASGRRFHGAIDSASSAASLVLVHSHQGVTRRRTMDWSRIVSAAVEGRVLDAAGLRELASAQTAAPNKGAVRAARGITPRRIELRAPLIPAPQPIAEQAGFIPVGPVTAVSFDSSVANWDGDVEVDGLVLDIAPADCFGNLVPAEGTLQVELFAPQRRRFDYAPLSGGDTLELVERWTRPVTVEHYGLAGLRIRLPFGAVHPELDVDWMAYWYGLVHVQLALPGHGVFEDSRDGMRIRPWAPNRDNLEMNTGRRFLPTERLGRHD